METKKTMGIDRSNSGLPTAAECGGGATNTGSATIYTGPSGEKPVAIYIPRKGYSNGNHAIIPLRVGMYRLEASRSRDYERVQVWRVVGFEGEVALLEYVGEYRNGDSNLPDFFSVPVAAALDKSNCYHCRSAHYVTEPQLKRY